ncbi:MAG TPA: SRPBCC family protein [Pirellulaceae bacterium]|nr:SRPBCC family protein [Pirellulaceae bacterium]
MPRIERVQLIRRPLDEVFGFFADAMNLEAITPPYLNFRILTPPPIAMHAGALIDYRLQLFGVPLKWRTEIERFEPNVRFVDRQLRGPYQLWHHLHEFHETSQGVVMVDQVDYRLGWSIFGGLAHVMFVRRTLDDIFDHRRRRITELLDVRPAAPALSLPVS